EEIRFIGEDNIKNESALRNLIRMGKAGKAAYVYCGSKSGLERVLPGVKVHVLGPPTLEQTSAIKRQRSRDSEEFWNFQSKLMNSFRLNAIPSRKGGGRPSRGVLRPSTRWIVQKVDRAQLENMHGIVRALDEQMNNTSVILLFEVNGKKLLFP